MRALPRGGLSRRFDAELLAALDQAYSLRAEAHTWTELPETFSAKLELMARGPRADPAVRRALRWSAQTRNWSFIDAVHLNPDTPQSKESDTAKEAA